MALLKDLGHYFHQAYNHYACDQHGIVKSILTKFLDGTVLKSGIKLY